MSCPVCMEDVCLTVRRFDCAHTLCKSCDAQIQVDNAICPLCRARRKKFVKVSSSFLRASVFQMEFVFNTLAYSSRSRRRHVIHFMMSRQSRSIVISRRKIMVDLTALGYDTFRDIHRFYSEGTGPMRRVSDDVILPSRRAHVTLENVFMVAPC